MLTTEAPVDLVVSTCTARDIRTWKVASHAQVKNLQALRRVVIVPDKEVKIFRDVSPSSIRVEPESDYSFEFVNQLRESVECAENQDRFGWYLQQYLKLEAIRRIATTETAVIWDADTVLLSPVRFFTNDGEPCFFHGSEYHIPYFMTIERALGLDKAVPQSFVAQCLPVAGSWLSCFFSALEQSGARWHETLMQSTDFAESSGFSEYETIGTFYAAMMDGRVHWQSGKWLRRGLTVFSSPDRALQRSARGRLVGLTFVSFEHWETTNSREVWINKFRGYARNPLSRKVAASIRKLRRALPSRDRTRPSSPTSSDFLRRAFERHSSLHVIQAGACDGEAHDPLRPFLQVPGEYSADLYEPIPDYFARLAALYEGRSDVRVHNAAVGGAGSSLVLHYIPPEVAEQMDGTGPPNRWAYGQGSFSRAVVVYWIYRNAFRGEEYAGRIAEWIGSIRSFMAQSEPIADVLRRAAERDCLLVLDVQGAEEGILSGMAGSLPKWIFVETDRDSEGIHQILTELGYVREIAGSNSCYALPGSELLDVREAS